MSPFRSNNKPRRDFGNREFGDRDFGGRPSGNRDFGNRPSPNRSFGAGKGKMFKATCSSCGSSCEVPFQPRGNKPVLCERCFKKDGRGSFDNAPSPSGDVGKKQLDEVNRKLDKILLLLEALVLDDEEYEDEDEEDFDEDEHQ